MKAVDCTGKKESIESRIGREVICIKKKKKGGPELHGLEVSSGAMKSEELQPKLGGVSWGLF